jgi:hypothetical protein
MVGQNQHRTRAVIRGTEEILSSGDLLSTLEMTSNYVHLLSQNVAKVQERVSPLERLGKASERRRRI